MASALYALLLIVALMLSIAVAIPAGRLDLEVTSNQAPEAFIGSTLTVWEGARLTIDCRATGTDLRRTYWYERKQLLASEDHKDNKRSQSTTLVLDPVTALDDGRILACRVDSSTQNKQVTLKVQKMEHTGFQMQVTSNAAGTFSSEGIVEANLGSKLELKCTLQGVGAHHLSWWYGKEQLTAVNEMDKQSATSSLVFDPVGAADHLKEVTCRVDASTMARTITLDVKGIQEGGQDSQEWTTILDKHLSDPVLQAIGVGIILLCGVLLIIACIIIIKALQAYIKIRDQEVKEHEQIPSSSSSQSNAGQKKKKKTPPMKQSLKNQILASTPAALLPRTDAPEPTTQNADQTDKHERVPLNQDTRTEGESNPNFVEDV